MYSAMDIANYLLFIMSDSYKDVTNMKLNKMLYYAQGHYLQEHGVPLFRDNIMSWEHGPVVPEVYHHFKYRASKPITTYDDSALHVIDEDTQPFLMEIARRYGRYTASTLRNMTHVPKSPWDQTKNGDVIAADLIKDYFDRNVRPLAPLEIEYAEDDVIGSRDSNGTLILPEDWQDEEV